MIQTSGNYNSILQGDFLVEYKFTVDGTDYFETDTVDGTIDEQLFEKFGVGNLMTKMLDIVFLPETDVPRKAVIEIYFRIKNEVQTSEWYPKGTYYVSTRTQLSDDSLRVRAYDASLKAKVVFAPEGSTWEATTALDLYVEICEKLGVNENEDTLEYIEDNNLPITVAPDMGQSGTTIKEILSYIGVLYGKNWVVNEYNELAMIFPYQTAPVYDLSDIYASPTVTVDRVRIWQNEVAYIEYPAVAQDVWDAMDGYVIEAMCPYVNSTNIADVASNIIGLEYTGFDAADVVENPALQLGDGMTLDGNEVMLARRLIVIGDEVTQCYAPYEEETENEYPELNPTARIVAKSEARTQASITVLNDAIQSEVIERTVQTTDLAQDITDSANDLQAQINATNQSIVDFSSSITQRADSIEATITQSVSDLETYANDAASGAAQDLANTISTYMKYSQEGGVGVLELGDSTSGYVAKLDNQELGFYDGNTKVAYISNNKLYITNAEITNNLQIGHYQWITDSTGRMSLKWVN